MYTLRIKVLAVLICLIGCGLKASAQELNCNVSVTAPGVQAVNQQQLQNIETSIRDFMNNRRWTNDQFEPYERIQCNVTIVLSSVTNNTDFSGSIQVTASRPVYGSTYTSGTVDFPDQNLSFSYGGFQSMNYQDGVYTDELTTILAFYANIILGFDYDSFSELGGTPYFQKAMSIVNSAQSSPASGWNAMEKNTQNRYQLASQLVDDRYIPIRKAYYLYHRLGLDLMFQDNQKALANVLKCLSTMQEVNKTYPNSLLMSMFFRAKYKELVDLFSQAPTSQKTQAKSMLTSMDIKNANRYEDALR